MVLLIPPSSNCKFHCDAEPCITAVDKRTCSHGVVRRRAQRVQMAERPPQRRGYKLATNQSIAATKIAATSNRLPYTKASWICARFAALAYGILVKVTIV